MTFELRVQTFDQGEINAKCTPCDKVTLHEWMKVVPHDPEATDYLTEAKVARRIVMCTECGNLGLKK